MASLDIHGWDELYQMTDQPKTMVLTFSDGTTINNDKICMEQMSLEESLCSEENLRYGCCESSCFQVRIVNNEQSFKDLYLNVVQAFPPQLSRLVGSDGSYIVGSDGNYVNGSENYYSQYGNFRVVSDVPTSDRQYRDLVCYDKMYDIIHANVFEWYNELEFPMTVKDFRDSFFEYLGITQETTTLINDDFEILGEFYVSEELSGRTVIESICEMNAVFGHINRNDIFEYISLPSSETLEFPHYVNGSCVYEDYETAEVTGVTAVNVTGDQGTKVGTEENVYLMQSNILTFGAEGTQELEDALTNILDVISEFTYRPFKATTYGNPMLPLGTNVVFNTRYKVINSFVMTRYLSGIQALRDSFTALGEKVYPSDVNRIKNDIIRSNGTTHKLVNDVNTLDSEIFDEHGNSRITQTLDKIVMKVDANGNVGVAELGSDELEETYMKFKANKVEITSDTIQFDNDGYKVSGEIYETIINPDEFKVKINYPHFDEDFFNPRIDDFNKDLYKHIMFNNYSFVERTAEDEEEKYQRLNAYNSLSIISPKTNGWITDSEETTELNNLASRTTIGEHFLITNEKYELFIADGGYIDDDGYFVFPNETAPGYYIERTPLSIGSYSDISGDIAFPIVMGKVKLSDLVGGGGTVVDDTSVCVFYDPIANPVYFNSNGVLYCWGLNNWYVAANYIYNSQYSNSSGSVGEGYLMHGTNASHKYACNWTGSRLDFYVDTTNVGYVSDKRLKEEIKPIDQNIIKAVCECKTYQFKAFNRGGLISVGIIAQDLVEACKKYNVNPMDYELLQKTIFKADDETEYYTIEYSQYLVIRSEYLQQQIDELKELMKK